MMVRRQLEIVNRRINNSTARGVVQLTDVSKQMQTLQVTVLKDEVLDAVQYFEPHGFTSRAKQGAEAVLLCPGGNRASAFAIAVSDRRFRIKDLGEGEVAMYDDANNLIHFKQDKTLSVKSDTSVDFDVPDITTTGNIVATGNINAGGNIHADGNVSADGDISDGIGSMQEMRDTYNGHNHPTAPTGPVSPPSVTM